MYKILLITDEDGNSHFNMRFLGSVEVSGHKGDEILCQAINKVRGHVTKIEHIILITKLLCCVNLTRKSL